MRRKMKKRVAKKHRLALWCSGELLKLRKMISDLRSQNRKLEDRVWKLEGHTVEEDFARIEEMITDFGNAAESLEKRLIS